MPNTRKQETRQMNESASLKISREEAASRIEDRIVKGSELKSALVNTQDSYESAKEEYRLWDDYNEEMLKRIFTTDEVSKEYSPGYVRVAVPGRSSSLGWQIKDLHRDIDRQIRSLKSILGRLELIPSVVAQPRENLSEDESVSLSKRVFLVHGHDEVAKTNLEIFLSEIGLEPIVLHRQADEGLTIIEKFEKHSDVGYAFILLTPDEVAYLAKEEEKADGERAKSLRARPNVIFEFGYFVGKLGRSRTCCLYTGEVELPSDISGMIYKKFSNSIEEVAYSITKELKALGYELI